MFLQVIEQESIEPAADLEAQGFVKIAGTTGYVRYDADQERWERRELPGLADPPSPPREMKIITIMGPDGVGKSTLTVALTELPGNHVEAAYMGIDQVETAAPPLRPLYGTLKDWRERLGPQSMAGGLVRLLIYGLRHINFHMRLRRYRGIIIHGGIMVLDRYLYDGYFQQPSRWSEWAFLKMGARPDLVILLTGDPAQINARKPELSVGELTAAMRHYERKLAEHAIPFEKIDTTALSVTESLHELVRILGNRGWLK